MRRITSILGLVRALAGSHAVAHPVRTALTLLGVALGVAAPVAIDVANRDVLRSFQQSIIEVAGSATLEIVGGEAGVPETVIEVVRRDADVVAALPMIQRTVHGEETGAVATMLGTDLLQARDVKPLTWGASDPSSARLLFEEDAALIGRRLAESWGIAAGARCRLRIAHEVRDIRIAGVIESHSEVASVWDHMMLVDIAPAQEWFGVVGLLDRIDVVTRPEADVDLVQQRLAAELPFGVTVRRPAQRGERVESMVAAFRFNLLMLSAVGLLVGAFLVYNTLSFSVAQRRHDIGILRAIGLSEAGVTAVFLLEGLAYGLVGGMAGSVLGLVLSHSMIGMVEQNISDLYVTVRGSLSTGTAVRPLLTVLMAGALGGAALSLLGAWAPSREASRTHVVAALAPGGYELARRLRVARWLGIGVMLLIAASIVVRIPPPGTVPLFGYLSVLCLLLGLSAMAPALVVGIEKLWVWNRARGQGPRIAVSLAGLAASAAGRAPLRNGVTMSSLVVGLAITVGVVLMIRSFRETVELWIDQTVMADFIVTPAGWLRGGGGQELGQELPRALADQLASVPGVAAVDTYRTIQIESGHRPRALVARDLRLHAERSRYLFLEGASSEVLTQTVQSRGVVVSEVLAGALGLQVGERLTLDTPKGAVTFPVQGVFLDYATDGGKVVMDRELFEEYWGDDRATVIPVYAESGADLSELAPRIAAWLQQEAHGGREYALLPNAGLKQEILEIFDRTFRLTYVLEAMAVAIALFGVVNTLLTAALERRRELATLQAVGASPGQIVGLLVWEAGYLGALGGVLGVLGGVGLAGILLRVVNKQSFGWTIPLSLQFTVLVAALLLAIVLACSAAYLTARWIARQPAASGLRYE